MEDGNHRITMATTLVVNAIKIRRIPASWWQRTDAHKGPYYMTMPVLPVYSRDGGGVDAAWGPLWAIHLT
jgi:hypothetical protein